MKIAVSALLASALLAGCATVSHTPLPKEKAAQLDGRAIVRTRYETPNFTAMTAGAAVFGALGAVAMIAEGNALVKRHGIADPAIEIGRQLSDRLAAARAMKAVASSSVASSDDAQALAAAYAGADYLLDVKTFTWALAYYPTDWTHYRVMYTARLRLIDAALKTVVAESMCTTTQGDDAKPPTKAQLLDDQAALLKSYLAKATAGCVEILAKDVLQL